MVIVVHFHSKLRFYYYYPTACLQFISNDKLLPRIPKRSPVYDISFQQAIRLPVCERLKEAAKEM